MHYLSIYQKMKSVLLSVGASAILATGCATTSTKKAAEVARPDAPPNRSVTQFEGALQCMDALFQEYGVRGETVAVSGVPDYTGRVFVGSDIWLQTAINRMSQRSRAFIVTDYNPYQLAPEQSLWLMSQKSGFYIPDYYIRGAISGFADNVVENKMSLGASAAMHSSAGGVNSAYSIVSVDLNVGNLSQRTLVTRAHASNEIVMRSKAKGAKMSGILSKFGANFEFVGSQRDGRAAGGASIDRAKRHRSFGPTNRRSLLALFSGRPKSTTKLRPPEAISSGA